MHSWNNIFDIGAKKVLRHTHVHMCKISAQYSGVCLLPQVLAQRCTQIDNIGK